MELNGQNLFLWFQNQNKCHMMLVMTSSNSLNEIALTLQVVGDIQYWVAFLQLVVQVKADTRHESSRARFSSTRSICAWVTPPATPPPYTPLHQTPPSASSTPGLAQRTFWNFQQGSDWLPRSPSPSHLQIPSGLCGSHLQHRGSAHSLVEAVSVVIYHIL